MFNFEFKRKAAREIEKLSPQIRERILKKLQFYSLQENPLTFAEKLKDQRFGEYRFRIGDYRILFDVKKNILLILKVGHRKEIYKN
ncbi:type II toxin-antitoxin system RelE/ParE family toxin [Patescibacteria group bacterium]|nr:type II toxin-antitoxin system RelE/ParE family toxin [Patescibacteria group bacterium]MBU4353233.1 type II toxin-antitoxin system RelE/ParE family toxin [Patescibacteria group bacterium]MBU4477129.1 type II toxin-antitoxin system RelE/ParE family toxin [Patescibacteria group bacterium]MCG2698942.1 type II toxin-antitoxin system RelE/ParE family toxin [Candidatus Parcubacteria bacterium]